MKDKKEHWPKLWRIWKIRKEMLNKQSLNSIKRMNNWIINYQWRRKKRINSLKIKLRVHLQELQKLIQYMPALLLELRIVLYSKMKILNILEISPNCKRWMVWYKILTFKTLEEPKLKRFQMMHLLLISWLKRKQIILQLK